MKKSRSIMISITVIGALLCAPAADLCGKGSTDSFVTYAAQKLAAPTTVKVIKKSSTSLKVSWNKVDGAKGYTVYKYDAKAKKFKKAKTLKKSQLSWVNKKLKKNKIYKYKVRAFNKVSGKIKYGSYSYVVSAKTYTKKAKKVNVKSVKVDYTNRYLGLKRAAKVDAWVNVPNGKQAISKKLAWTSSNSKVVKVTKSGWIQGQGKEGTAKVYIRAHNGVTKTMKVIVGDYANPSEFTNLDKVAIWNTDAVTTLTTYKNDMCKVATYLEKYKTTTGFVYEDGDIQVDGQGINYDPIKVELENLLKNAKMGIQVGENYIFFSFLDPIAIITPTIVYTDYNGPDNQKWGTIKIAPCWYFNGDAGV